MSSLLFSILRTNLLFSSGHPNSIDLIVEILHFL